MALPEGATRRLVTLLLIAVAMALVTQLAIFYLALGWFLHYVWVLGGLIAAAITWRGWRPGRGRIVALPLVLFVYAGTIVALESTLVGQEVERTFAMEWENRGVENEFNEPEIVLRFIDHPAHLFGMYSTELARYLEEAGTDRVRVTFEVTRDYGCLRGYRMTRVGDLTRWRSRWGYAGFRGRAAEAPPWGKDPFWCP